MQKPDLRYLELLSKNFPTIDATLTEIINLEAILNLPKGTEHFLSDLHGEFEAFEHVLRNGSGNLKIKIQEIFNNRLTNREMNTLATLVYYPEEKMKMIIEGLDSEEEIKDWYRITISRLIELTASAGSKYTRSKVRKALPKEFAYVIEELLSRDGKYIDKTDYYNEIITSIVDLDCADDLIIAICHLIQQLIVDHIHILGDIYDRGPCPEKIIGRLKKHHSVDVQWGNHDILWFGAASGSPACIANVLRIASRYDNLETIEDSYGISLRQLIAFVESTYGGVSNKNFYPKVDETVIDTYPHELEQLGRVQQAMAIIQFKLEGQIIKRNPDFNMKHRLLLDKIDFDRYEITIDGKTYPLNDKNFPTIDPRDPYKLSKEETDVMERLVHAFTNSKHLQDDAAFLINNGGMYLKYNENLLFHGCIPMDKDGNFMSFHLEGQEYKGKALFDKFDEIIRNGFFEREKKSHFIYLDLIWYLWCGEKSPLFGKKAMKTFERYYIDDKESHIEEKNAYYHLREDEDIAIKILKEFGINPETGHIINGHTPVKERKGENPVKANGRLIVIDGGYSPTYQDTTGLGGYTLLYNSYGLKLCVHEPFTSKEDAINNETDIVSTRRVVDLELERAKIKDTDKGKKLMQESYELKCLLKAYRSGKIKEKG
ncbi:MAG: fructose-1,6-bisphosphatase [Clostridiales bacterium]|nr:fructose-1,6-bisphosphatase [Clostridiales bacterium]